MITTEQIKELRDRTGVSVMQCKKALEDAGGDMEKAILLLRKKSGDIADKKSDRALASGAVASYIHMNRVGSMVLLSCETDFVAKNDEFQKLAFDIAMHVAATNPKYVKAADVSEEELKKIREALQAEVPADKPKDIQEKILEGKVNDYLKGTVLLEQSFIKDDSMTIEGLLQGAVQKFGERTEVSKMVRFSVT